MTFDAADRQISAKEPHGGEAFFSPIPRMVAARPQDRPENFDIAGLN